MQGGNTIQPPSLGASLIKKSFLNPQPSAPRAVPIAAEEHPHSLQRLKSLLARAPPTNYLPPNPIFLSQQCMAAPSPKHIVTGSAGSSQLTATSTTTGGLPGLRTLETKASVTIPSNPYPAQRKETDTQRLFRTFCLGLLQLKLTTTPGAFLMHVLDCGLDKLEMTAEQRSVIGEALVAFHKSNREAEPSRSHEENAMKIVKAMQLDLNTVARSQKCSPPITVDVNTVARSQKCSPPIATSMDWKSSIISKNLEKSHSNFFTANEGSAQIPNSRHLTLDPQETALQISRRSRIHWLPGEDAKLKEGVERLGTKSWTKVSHFYLGGYRSSKQCRERYMVHLQEARNTNPFSPKEDKLLVELQSKMGNKWTTIASLLKGRSALTTKNRFNSLLRKNSKQPDTVKKRGWPQIYDFNEAGPNSKVQKTL